MARPVRKGSARALNTPKITLKFKVSGSEQVEYALFRKVKNYADDVRDRFFDLYFDAVKEYVDFNITQERQHTNTPDSGTLYESVVRDFTESSDTLHIYIDHNIAPYGWIRNLPRGDGVFIYPKRVKYLKFFWHRRDAFQRRKFVFSPGSAFFSRAWFSALENADDLLRQAKEEVRLRDND